MGRYGNERSPEHFHKTTVGLETGRELGQGGGEKREGGDEGRGGGGEEGRGRMEKLAATP